MMKTYPARAIAALAFSAAIPACLHAENLVVNGDFENGKGVAFNMTPPWYNRGAGSNQGTAARTDKSAIIAGAYSAIISDRHNTTAGTPGPLAHAQKTNHRIKAGDSFDLHYDWLPADKYWQTARDTVRFVLYATKDDRMGGPVVWSSVLTADFFRGNINTPQAVSQTTGVVSPEAVGKTLFIMFHGLDTVDGTAGNAHYARVDNILITTSSAPRVP